MQIKGLNKSMWYLSGSGEGSLECGVKMMDLPKVLHLVVGSCLFECRSLAELKQRLEKYQTVYDKILQLQSDTCNMEAPSQWGT